MIGTVTLTALLLAGHYKVHGVAYIVSVIATGIAVLGHRNVAALTLPRTPAVGSAAIGSPTGWATIDERREAHTRSSWTLDRHPTLPLRSVETRKLLVELSSTTDRELSALSASENLNKTTVVNRAVHVYTYVQDVERAGDSLYVCRGPAKVLRRVRFA